MWRNFFKNVKYLRQFFGQNRAFELKIDDIMLIKNRLSFPKHPSKNRLILLIIDSLYSIESYLGHFLIYSVQIFKVNAQVYFSHNYVAESSILALKNLLADRCSNLVGKFRNLSAKYFGGLNSKISIVGRVCNESFNDYP